MEDKIEILTVSLLDEHRRLVSEIKRLAWQLGIELGWHYLLDVAWIISHLGDVRGRRILDAGAGVGILQWYLSLKEAEVYSVDRESRANLPINLRMRFRVVGLREQDLPPLRKSIHGFGSHGEKLPRKFATTTRDAIRSGARITTRGRVVIYHQDLSNLVDIKDDSCHFVVAVSALEHNSPEKLEDIIPELMRVLKPGGALLATFGASSADDWLHEPSQGWCYSEKSLRKLFGVSEHAPSNFDRYDQLFASLRDCSELRDGLASFYTRSGDNGMPWGVWNPQYQPVGVCKVKTD